MTFNLSAVPAFQPQPLLPGWRSDRAPPVVFAVTGLILAAGVMPGFHWHDTAEFGAVASRLSLSHPPGHPLHALTTRAVLDLPLGDLAFRANVASSVCLAFALSVFARVLGVLAPGLSWFERFVFASWPVVFPVVFLQGIRAEVYALNLLVTLGVAYCVVELRPLEGGRFFVALALLVGLGLGNHSLLIAALAPIVVWRAARSKLRLRAWLLALAAGLLGASSYVYLPLRASAGGDVGWGRPETLAAFVDTVLARDWHKNLASAGSTGLDLWENALGITGLLAAQPGLVVATGAALLFGWALLRRPGTRARIAALALSGACLLATRFFYPFDENNPDLGGYFAPALFAWVGTVAVAFAELAPRVRPVLSLLLLLAAAVSVADVDPGQRRGSRAAEVLSNTLVDEVPPRGVLVTSDYSTWFQSWAQHDFAGARPDVAVLFRGRVEQAWHISRVSSVHPEVAALMSTFPASFDRPGIRFENGVEWARLGALAARLRPAGLTLALHGPTKLPPAAPPVPTTDVDTRWTQTFRFALLAEHCLNSVPKDALCARKAIDAARAYLPAVGDEWLDALEAALTAALPPE